MVSRISKILENPEGISRTVPTDLELLAFAFMDYKKEVDQKFQEDSHVIQSLQKEIKNLHARLDGMSGE